MRLVTSAVRRQSQVSCVTVRTDFNALDSGKLFYHLYLLTFFLFISYLPKFHHESHICDITSYSNLSATDSGSSSRRAASPKFWRVGKFSF